MGGPSMDETAAGIPAPIPVHTAWQTQECQRCQNEDVWGV